MSEHVKPDLPAYIDGEMDASRRESIEAHLNDCSSCRSAANKLRAKLSSAKRKALKGASADRIPNLLLTRLGRQAYVAPRSSSAPLILVCVGVVLVLLGAAWLIHRPSRFHFGRPFGGAHDMPVVASTAVAAAYDVEHSSPSTLRDDSIATASSSTTTKSTESTAPGAPGGALPHWGADDCNVKQARQMVIRGRPAWRALWSEIGQDGSAPHVNFNDFVVIGIFAGERVTGHYEFTLSDPIDQDDAIIIPYTIVGPGAAVSPATATVHPYYLTLIQRSPKPIRLVEKPISN